MSETIAALASGQGRAGIAVIRLSGPQTQACLTALAGGLPKPRHASLSDLRDSKGALIDRGLVLFFPAPASFTGEDAAELHCHGGRAVVAALLAALVEFPGVRLAGPGEFTRRAVENGRLDLTQAEALADLVAADTTAQRRQALAGAGGALSRACEAWRGRLVELAALCEAEIDFSDEEDVPALLASVRAGAQALAAEIEVALARSGRAERLRDGAVFVIAGPPNAGKSSLLNALAQRDVAIVTDVAGTTRDLIEISLDLDGLPATLVDTAGLRDSADAVEAIGIARAREAAERADLVLWVTAPDAFAAMPGFAAPVLRLRAKADRADAAATEADLDVSARSGLGLDALLRRLAEAARTALEGAEGSIVTRARQRQELQGVAAALRRVGDGDMPGEFVAEDLRLALRGIGRVTGTVDIDEIYDRIFSSFCIGK